MLDKVGERQNSTSSRVSSFFIENLLRSSRKDGSHKKRENKEDCRRREALFPLEVTGSHGDQGPRQAAHTVPGSQDHPGLCCSGQCEGESPNRVSANTRSLKQDCDSSNTDSRYNWDSLVITEPVDGNNETDTKRENSVVDEEDDNTRHSFSEGPEQEPSETCETVRKKKSRTVFSRSQVLQLESTFDMKRYLSSSERAGLAAALQMSQTQVKIWFQNRRNKWKRQLAADMEVATLSSPTPTVVRVPVIFHESSTPPTLGFGLPRVSPPLIGFSSTVNYPISPFPPPMSFIRSQMTGLV